MTQEIKELLNNQNEYIEILQEKLRIYEEGSKASNLLLGYVVNEFDKKKQEYNEKIEDREKANIYLQADYNSLRENYLDLQAEYAALEDSFNDLDEELEKVLNELDDLELENENLRRKNYTLHVESPVTDLEKEEMRKKWLAITSSTWEELNEIAYRSPNGVTFKIKL